MDRKQMKQVLYTLTTALCLLLAVNASAQETKKAVISLPVKEYNFGTIKEGDGKVSHVFEIKNVGDAPLVLTRVMSPCGCTVPSYSKEPVAPGKSTKLTVTYDPTGRVYPFVKTISIYSNGKEGPEVITIKGEVVR